MYGAVRADGAQTLKIRLLPTQTRPWAATIRSTWWSTGAPRPPRQSTWRLRGLRYLL